MEQKTVRPFHATILVGEPEERRKKAIALAQALVCSGENKPCGLCRDCRKAAEGIHPDVVSVEQFMEEKDIGGMIKIDAVRALRNDAVIIPNEAARKVYLIDNAQNLNINAQNALLKLLEEGPDYAAFLLLCDRAGSLLETIRSRCAVASVGQQNVSTQWDEQALTLAGVLAGGDELEKNGFFARFELSKPEKTVLDQFLLSLEQLFYDAAIGGVTGRFETQQAQRLAARIDRKQLLDWAEATRQARDMTQFHVAVGHLLGWLGTKL